MEPVSWYNFSVNIDLLPSHASLSSLIWKIREVCVGSFKFSLKKIKWWIFFFRYFLIKLVNSDLGSNPMALLLVCNHGRELQMCRKACQQLYCWPSAGGSTLLLCWQSTHSLNLCGPWAVGGLWWCGVGWEDFQGEGSMKRGWAGDEPGKGAFLFWIQRLREGHFTQERLGSNCRTALLHMGRG